jgi:acetyl esterase/lipase
VASFGPANGEVGASATRWEPPAGLQQIPIWPNGVPDVAEVVQSTESVQVKPGGVAGLPVTMIHDVSVPTLTIVRPKGRNTGVAMVVFPGGGFKVLAMDLEGTDICDWVTAQGMTCALLKYRVPKSDVHWENDCQCEYTPKILRALQDAQRAIKITRFRAKELGIDPEKIGVIGFSAGGYLVAQTSNIFAATYKTADKIDEVSSRPNFAVAAYPGHLCRDDATFDPTIHVTKQTPPTFIVQDWDDSNDPVCNSTMYARALDTAGVQAEVHLFAKGDHAFALRHIGHPVEMWPSLVEKWLKEISIL